ncbi:MAG: hypothetical protein IJO03_06630 [Clostridia bacterium]|nr:hypothetical protein [Clostridia bacterium]MBQ7121923.1 hypothetical protein [Clostridia bacterium]
MMRFWQIIKSKFNEIIGNTRAELKLNKDNNSNEYIINGVRYIVSTQFSKTENKTMIEKLSDFIGSDFAHLTNNEDKNTIQAEYVCSTAGKED